MNHWLLEVAGTLENSSGRKLKGRDYHLTANANLITVLFYLIFSGLVWTDSLNEICLSAGLVFEAIHFFPPSFLSWIVIWSTCSCILNSLKEESAYKGVLQMETTKGCFFFPSKFTVCWFNFFSLFQIEVRFRYILNLVRGLFKKLKSWFLHESKLLLLTVQRLTGACLHCNKGLIYWARLIFISSFWRA